MRRLIRKWLGFVEIENLAARVYELEKKDVDRKYDLEVLTRDSRHWREIWSMQQALEKYLNIELERHQVPDLSYRYPQEETPFMTQFTFKDKKKKKWITE